MRLFIIILLFLYLFGCTTRQNFDKDYYERVTKIKFPDNYNIVTTADNGEFVTITILDLYKKDCRKFIIDNNFERWDKNYSFPFEGLFFLDSSYRKFPDSKSYYSNCKGKVRGQVGWTYVIDTLTCRLYCEIEYPDMGGN